ncbi:phage minor capsid protein, partial [Treponema saccharophilum]|uniref:phage minor capsid protein n=1 Tax=Treponema saccharophilum TaxID=165 RepID=UPI0038640915
MCGINCRHSFYPYFDGMKAHYGADELDEMAGEKVRFTGSDGVEHELTRYEGEQKLRGIERKIRYYKKKALVRQSAGVDDTAARRKLGEWQAAARDFTRQTGITRDYAREYVGAERNLFNPRQAQPRGSKGTKEKYVKTAKDTTIQTASDIKKDDDIVDYFINKYGAETNNRITFMNVENVKAFNKGFEDMQKD